MADTPSLTPPPVPGQLPVSPVGVPPVTPVAPVVPSTPVVPEPLAEETPTSSLSPFKILAKKDGAQNVVNPPVAPSSPIASQAPVAAQTPGAQVPGGIMVATPSRDELLKQAAEAPAASFILPPPEVIAMQNTAAAKPLMSHTPRPVGAAVQPLLEKAAPIPAAMPKPALGTPSAPLPGQQVPFTPKAPFTPPALRQPSAPLPANGGVKPRIPGRVTPAIQTSLASAGGAGFGTPKKHKSLVATVLVGLLILMIVGGGIAYAMAKNGSRVPVLFAMVSGLQPTGLASNAQALSYVQARTRYQVQGEVELVRSDIDLTSGKPDLSTAGDTTAGSIYRVKSQLAQGEFSEKGAQHMGSLALTINQNDPIQLATGQKPASTDADNWSIYFSSNEKPELVSIKSSLVAKTLLQPVLQPISLEKLLTLPTGELAYQKQTGTKAGTMLSAHSFTVGTDKLKDFFPAGAVLENFTLTTRYTWAQGSIPAGQPTTADLKGTVTYLQKKYTYTSAWRYGNWDKPLETSEDISGGLAALSAKTATPASMSSATAQMGILSLASLPNTLSETEGGATTATGPITPTGEGITIAGSKIIVAPPVPAKPASAEAKARDVQRLKDLSDTKLALEAYKKVKGSYPVSITLLQTTEGGMLLTELVSTYMTKLPIDPSKTVYWYEYTSNGTSFTLRAVAEDPESATVKQGSVYPYFEVTN
ncbi:hypothetical protein BH11PAT4_BH11PAT4_4430 [soil metagenome]